MKNEVIQIREVAKSLNDNKIQISSEVDAKGIFEAATSWLRRSGKISGETFSNVQISNIINMETLEIIGDENEGTKFDTPESLRKEREAIFDNEKIEARKALIEKFKEDKKVVRIEVDENLFELLEEFRINLPARTKGVLKRASMVWIHPCGQRFGVDWIYVKDLKKYLSQGAMVALNELKMAIMAIE